MGFGLKGVHITRYGLTLKQTQSHMAQDHFQNPPDPNSGYKKHENPATSHVLNRSSMSAILKGKRSVRNLCKVAAIAPPAKYLNQEYMLFLCL